MIWYYLNKSKIQPYSRLGTTATAQRSSTMRCGTWKVWWRIWMPSLLHLLLVRIKQLLTLSARGGPFPSHPYKDNDYIGLSDELGLTTLPVKYLYLSSESKLTCQRKRKCKANREIVFKKKWFNIFWVRHVGLFNTNTDGADWLTDVLYSMEAFPLFISQFLHESFISLTMQLFRRILNQSNVLFSRIFNHYHK